MTKSTDEIMEWQGREQSSIEPYCTGYLWVLDGEPTPGPAIQQLPYVQQQSLMEGIDAARAALRHSTNRYSPNRVTQG
jgi:hypothetical protein